MVEFTNADNTGGYLVPDGAAPIFAPHFAAEGFFPVESPADFCSVRDSLEATILARLREKMRAAVDLDAKQEEELVLHGDPSAPAPRGIFHVSTNTVSILDIGPGGVTLDGKGGLLPPGASPVYLPKHQLPIVGGLYCNSRGEPFDPQPVFDDDDEPIIVEAK